MVREAWVRNCNTSRKWCVLMTLNFCCIFDMKLRPNQLYLDLVVVLFLVGSGCEQVGCFVLLPVMCFAGLQCYHYDTKNKMLNIFDKFSSCLWPVHLRGYIWWTNHRETDDEYGSHINLSLYNVTNANSQQYEALMRYYIGNIGGYCGVANHFPSTILQPADE